MSEKNIYCESTNCAHNYNQSCRAGCIHIRGSYAKEIKETTCSTYFADSVGFFTSIIKVGGNTYPNNIVCEASNCVYNDNSICTSDKVHINSHYSSCETFKNK